MRASSRSSHTITGHRVIFSGEATPARRSSSSESDSASLIGLAGIDNLDHMEESQAEPRLMGRRALARLGPIALPKLPGKPLRGRRATACLGPIPLPQLPHQPPQLATLQTPASVPAVPAVPTTSAATRGSIESDRDVADSAYSRSDTSSNHSAGASSFCDSAHPTVSQLGVRFAEAEAAEHGVLNDRPAPPTNDLLDLGQALAGIQAQQAVILETLMGIQVQMQQQQEAIASLVAHRAAQGGSCRISQIARVCWQGVKRVFGIFSMFK